MVKPVLLIGTALAVLLAGGAANAADAETQAEKELSGMSVLGNNEAPKSLVIVPWKSSEIGDGVGVANMLDGRAAPVDRDVFSREIEFYELRSAGSKRSAMQPVASAEDALAQH
jgi:hypothetical protein